MLLTKRRLPALLIGALLFFAAFSLRSAAYQQVFVGDETFVFADDPPYHLIRTQQTLDNYPKVPNHDPRLNFPHGGELIWPPGMPLLLATIAKLGGLGPRASLGAIAAWIPPLVGALTVLLLFLGTKRWLGLIGATTAAALLVIIPAHVQYSVISRFDHHLFEPLFLMLICWPLVSKRRSSIAIGALAVGGLLLFVPGALILLGLICAAILLCIQMLRLREADIADRIALRAALLLSLGLVCAIPACLASPWRTRFVFFAPSLLHLAALFAATASLTIYLRTPLRRLRCGPALAAGLAICGFALVPSCRNPLVDGLSYLSNNPFLPLSLESRGILSAPQLVVDLVGWPLLAFAVATPALLLWRRSPGQPSSDADHAWRSGSLLVVFGATLLLLAGSGSTRFLCAWSPFGALAVGVGLARLRQHLGQHRRLFALILGALAAFSTPQLFYSLSLEVISPAQRAGQRFFRQVRQLTPERTDYGLLADWSIGHVLSYLSGRPTLANNFFGIRAYDEANAQALRLLLSPCEQTAEAMERLGLRYLLTSPLEPEALASMARAARLPDVAAYQSTVDTLGIAAQRSTLIQLGVGDGQQGRDRQNRQIPACGRFRLIAEAHIAQAPAGAPGDLKLYRRVIGALLTLTSATDQRVELSLPLGGPRGRRFVWRTSAWIGARRPLQLRLPYPTDKRTPAPIQPLEPAYRLLVGQRSYRLEVTSQQVERGEPLPLLAPAAN
ncbi:MAG: hypothetical protein H6707_14070 [Deltaproteobacteria bacterium]|nr:hypothetical protein [Deltaproteobacteria bacterium]